MRFGCSQFRLDHTENGVVIYQKRFVGKNLVGRFICIG